MPLWERVLVKWFLEDYELGLFALAARIAAISTLIESAFNTAWGPVYLKISNRRSSHRIFSITLKLIALVSSFFLLLMSIFSSNIVEVVGESSYSESQILIFPLVLSICIQLIANVTQVGILIEKKPIYYLISYLLYAIIFTTVFILSVPYLGLISIGWSIAIASLCRAYFVSKLSNKIYKVSWPYFKALAPFSFAVCTAYSISLKGFIPSNYYFKFSLLLVSCLLVLFIFMSLLSKFDKAFLVEIQRRFAHS